MKTLMNLRCLGELDTKRTVLKDEEKERILRALELSIEAEKAFLKGKAERNEVIRKHNELIDVAKEIFK